MIAALACCFGLILSYFMIGYYSGNFTTIVGGEAYRSGQLSPTQIESVHSRLGIASIINLRGENRGTDWYDAERATASRLGIEHLDFSMSARRELQTEDALRLIQMMRDAPKPVLIHCEGGADRTGLAAALYIAGLKNGTGEQAEWHLSPVFGHLAIPGHSQTWAMDLSWQRMAPLLGVAGR